MARDGLHDARPLVAAGLLFCVGLLAIAVYSEHSSLQKSEPIAALQVCFNTNARHRYLAFLTFALWLSSRQTKQLSVA
jgi:hypothetical protein